MMGTNINKLAKKVKNYPYILLVMRHAKTEPSNEHGDFERELVEKGFKQAKKMAKGLTSLGLIPDQIDCSSAVRARQTCERMLKIFGDKPKLEYQEKLYSQGMQVVFDDLAACKAKRHIVMILGHEPTVSMACQWIAHQDSDPQLKDLLNLGMSTGCVAVFGANVPFQQWDIHQGTLLAVLSPKDFA